MQRGTLTYLPLSPSPLVSSPSSPPYPVRRVASVLLLFETAGCTLDINLLLSLSLTVGLPLPTQLALMPSRSFFLSPSLSSPLLSSPLLCCCAYLQYIIIQWYFIAI